MSAIAPVGSAESARGILGRGAAGLPSRQEAVAVLGATSPAGQQAQRTGTFRHGGRKKPRQRAGLVNGADDGLPPDVRAQHQRTTTRDGLRHRGQASDETPGREVGFCVDRQEPPCRIGSQTQPYLSSALAWR